MKELPKDWRIVDFENCIEKDNTPSKIKLKRSEYLEKGAFPIIDQGQDFIAGYSNDETKIFPNEGESVIFGDHTRILKFVNFPFCVGADGTKILRVRKSILTPKFFYYQLRWMPIENAGYSRHYRFLRRKKIIVPPIECQKQIVRILEKADLVKEKKEQAKTMASKLLQATFLQMFGDPVVNPKGWQITIINNVTSKGATKGSTPTTYGFNWEENGILFLRSECVTIDGISLAGSMHISKFAHDAMERSKVYPNDILIRITGDVGISAIFPQELVEANINQHIAIVRLAEDSEVDPIFLLTQLNTVPFRKRYSSISRGVTHPHLSLQQIRETKIIIPPLREQDKFVLLAKKIERITNSQKNSSNRITELQNSLISRAFKGELTQ